MDFLYVGLAVLFFGLSWGLVKLVHRRRNRVARAAGVPGARALEAGALLVTRTPVKPLSWKAYGVGVVVFNVLLALVMYLVMSLLQWGFFQ